MNEIQKDLQIYSEEVRDVLSAPPKQIVVWGNTILFFFILMILFLSFIIKYPDIIEGQGVLTTNIPPQKEFSRITAKIDTLLVKENQSISNDKTIAILENTAKYEDIIFLKKITDSINNFNSNFNFPIYKIPILFLGEVTSDYNKFENSYFKYIMDKSLNPFQYESNTDKVKINELKQQLKILKSQSKISYSEITLKTKGLNRDKLLFGKGVISLAEYQQKQLDFLKIQKNHKNLNSSISKIREQINSLINSKIENTITNSNKKIQLKKYAIQSFIQLKKSIRNWELKYTFKSKIEGRVSYLKYWSKNQTVNSGDLVCTIIPTNHKGYIVKAKIPTLNSGKLNVGQKVHIKLLSYPQKEFGIILGKVISISEIPNDDGNYLLDISIDKNDLTTTYGKKIIFKQEMLATVNIVTEDLRLIERFFYNFKEIFE